MSSNERLPIVLAAPVRTPIGRFGGALSTLTAPDLGAAAATATIERAGIDPGDIDQVVFGHARQAGAGPNPARQIGHRCGVPDDRPAFTVNQACGSGLQAVFCAARAIRHGEAEVVLAGGTESMSNTPYLLPRARWGYRIGNAELVDGMYRDGFSDPLSGLIMGETAEELGDETGVTRAEADAYAARSQNRCEAATERGRFAAEIVPVSVAGKHGDTLVGADEHPRAGVSVQSLAKLPTVFREGGTVTPGNASGITDGAASILVASESAAIRLGLDVVARLVDWRVVGVEPRIMGIGPVPATRQLLQRQGLDFDDIDLVELNEAFATQVLACLKELPFDESIVNADGGAIALGHPIGCTGTRILVTLLHGMQQRRSGRGIATLCVSGGLGLSALVEMRSS